MSDLIRKSDALRRIALTGEQMAGASSSDVTTAIHRAIAALPAVTVGVKPLVWEDVYRDGRMFEVPRGSNPFGFAATIHMRHATKWVYDGAGYPSLDAAKAAAQADYEARILAALEPVAAPDLAAIREAALREAADVAASAEITLPLGRGMPDGASIAQRQIVATILALIQKGAADDRA